MQGQPTLALSVVNCRHTRLGSPHRTATTIPSSDDADDVTKCRSRHRKRPTLLSFCRQGRSMNCNGYRRELLLLYFNTTFVIHFLSHSAIFSFLELQFSYLKTEHTQPLVAKTHVSGRNQSIQNT